MPSPKHHGAHLCTWPPLGRCSHAEAGHSQQPPQHAKRKCNHVYKNCSDTIYMAPDWGGGGKSWKMSFLQKGRSGAVRVSGRGSILSCGQAPVSNSELGAAFLLPSSRQLCPTRSPRNSSPLQKKARSKNRLFRRGILPNLWFVECLNRVQQKTSATEHPSVSHGKLPPSAAARHLHFQLRNIGPKWTRARFTHLSEQPLSIPPVMTLLACWPTLSFEDFPNGDCHRDCRWTQTFPGFTKRKAQTRVMGQHKITLLKSTPSRRFQCAQLAQVVSRQGCPLAACMALGKCSGWRQHLHQTDIHDIHK